ncbi:MAG: MotA/TolQ/ExbB proton channel family protein [Opitutales bacterium]|nr:MotA/TolQ/ExbB proton channel family protein [Opitutales bacterium]
MQTIIEGAGWFIWPLGFCSILAMAVILERMLALREARILPKKALELILAGDFEAAAKAFPKTAGGRIVAYALRENPDSAALTAFARLEVSRMERGMFIPESIVSIAPLIGLFGTVYGLYILFPETGGMPDQQMLVRGVGLALTTTMLGLLIAMPVLLANNFIMRRIEVLSARLALVVERLNSN